MCSVGAGVSLAGGLVLVGSCTGPILSVSSVELQDMLPQVRTSEGFSVAYVVQSVGFVSGSFGVGVLNLATASGAGTTLTAIVVSAGRSSRAM